MATTQSHDSGASSGKTIGCANCGNIHPTDAACKPWGDEDV
ncbi:hypothetical protein [Halobellus ordinarius]|nr:hypothetical protein [Halobellus sp. ZY16]